MLIIFILSCSSGVRQSVIFKDHFDSIPGGIIYSTISSQPYYFKEYIKTDKNDWKVATTLNSKGFDKAWRITSNDSIDFLAQTFTNLDQDYNPISLITHPLIVAGDRLWGDYTIEFKFSPLNTIDKCGVVFRFQDDRNFYFYGMEGNTIMLKLIHQSTAPRRPLERILAFRPFIWEPGKVYRGLISVREDKITTFLNDSLGLHAKDDTYGNGMIGLLSDNPAEFYSIEARSLSSEQRKFTRRIRQEERDTEQNIKSNPHPVIWKKLDINGLGGNINIRYGELDGDGNKELVVVQSVKKENGISGISCLTALNLNGEILWQYGNPLEEYSEFAEELPVEIHDLDGDGEREVIFINDGKLVRLNGLTGKLEKQISLPKDMHVKALCFADLMGSDRDNFILLSDRSSYVMALNEKLSILWTSHTNSGSQPVCYDIDGDFRDEILFGYIILDNDGELLKNFGQNIKDACNGLALTEIVSGDSIEQQIVCAAGDWGLLYFNLDGSLLHQYTFGHVQYFSVADFDIEKPGLEIVSSNSWGGHGVIQCLNSEGEQISKYILNTYGAIVTPVNWKGDGQEYFMLNASHEKGGLYGIDGQKHVTLPDDGHPERCFSVLDLTGDPRDEIVVWDNLRLWIYSQDDNPRSGKTYNPSRIPLYNYSVYNIPTSYSDW